MLNSVVQGKANNQEPGVAFWPKNDQRKSAVVNHREARGIESLGSEELSANSYEIMDQATELSSEIECDR